MEYAKQIQRSRELQKRLQKLRSVFSLVLDMSFIAADGHIGYAETVMIAAGERDSRSATLPTC
jgi:hypothetical protein